MMCYDASGHRANLIRAFPEPGLRVGDHATCRRHTHCVLNMQCFGITMMILLALLSIHSLTSSELANTFTLTKKCIISLHRHLNRHILPHLAPLPWLQTTHHTSRNADKVSYARKPKHASEHAHTENREGDQRSIIRTTCLLERCGAPGAYPGTYCVLLLPAASGGNPSEPSASLIC